MSTIRRSSKRNFWKGVLVQRQGWKCNMCHNKTEKFELDHIVALIFGGDDTLQNCQVLCVSCHKKKTRKQMASYRSKMAKSRMQNVDQRRKISKGVALHFSDDTNRQKHRQRRLDYCADRFLNGQLFMSQRQQSYKTVIAVHDYKQRLPENTPDRRIAQHMGISYATVCRALQTTPRQVYLKTYGHIIET